MLAAGTAALAVFAGCTHVALSERAEPVGTRGYRLAPPKSVGPFKAEYLYGDTYVGVVDCAGAPSDADCYIGATEVGGIGIAPRDANRIIAGATGTGANYWGREPRMKGRYFFFRGLQGNVPHPEKALRAMLRSIHRKEQEPFRDTGVKWDGPARPVSFPGYEGAVMWCREGGELSKAVDSGTVTRDPVARCVWADHSTVVATESDSSVTELVELTRELHRTARVRK
ncbi:hypothetical protein J116_027295 [Streptomyces thermolilacinus SPC6]|uniref:DUF3558 domain-containing protein n=2 Tax=Streptomyces thermolilacinus TaxID=285540 RepID=A0A1D3DZ82_9ACTN|nr:hypothetical protein J116_027295 [Streptomyces thermolilacinus SPC6]